MVIIVSWSVLAHESHVSRLANFAAMPEPNITRGRAFDAWLDFAVRELPERINDLRTVDLATFERTNESKLSDRLASPHFQATVPLKIGHGSMYESYSKMKSKPIRDPAASKKDLRRQALHPKSCPKWTSYSGPPLQMFRFNRLVIDECHYLLEGDQKNSMALSLLKRTSAHKRWILSGTPALSNFLDVNQIASLLGTTLGRDILGDGKYVSQREKKLLADQSDAEKFLARTELHSYAWHEERHQRAQNFLDAFVRQNEPQLGHIAYTETLRAVELGIAHHAVYVELSQHLIAQRMQIKKLKDCSQSDRIDRLNASLNNSTTAEEALLKCAIGFQTSTKLFKLDDLMRKRKTQITQTKKELLATLEEAEKYVRGSKIASSHYYSLKRNLQANHMLGDRDAGDTVRDLITFAEKKSGGKENSISEKVCLKKLKEPASSLRSLAQEFTLQLRSFRFIESINRFLPLLRERSNRAANMKCSSSTCSGTASALDRLFIVSRCGHIICENCLEKRNDKGSCIDMECNALELPANLIKATELSSEREEILTQ